MLTKVSRNKHHKLKMLNHHAFKTALGRGIHKFACGPSDSGE